MISLRRNGREHGRTHGSGWRSVFGAALVAICVGTAMLGALAVTSSAAADGRPPGGQFNDPVVRAVDIAQPSIVRLATIYTAHVTMSLCGQDVTLPTSGDDYTLGATGSGAFISANGDILTADHVVDVPKDLLDQAVFQDPKSAGDIANLLNTNPGCHLSQAISAADVAAGYVQYAGIPYTVHYSSPRRLVWQSTAFTGPVSNTSENSTLEGLLAAPYHDATVVSSSSVNDNDVAIVHVDLSDTPNIQLDNSASVAVEDQLTIIGYPGNGDVTNDGTDLLTPSVNIITVSAVKSGDNGEQLIQVGGNVEHGDSGGPALDARGHIVGIVSFGFVGPDSPGSTAFLRSSNSVRSLISEAGISTTPGAFEKSWETAFTDYAATYAGHWHAASRELDDLSSRYPDFKGIQQYKDFAESAAAVEAAPTTSSQFVEIGGGVAALLALILLAVLVPLVVRSRRKKRQPAYAAAGQAQPYGALYSYGYNQPAFGPPSQQFGVYGPPSIYGSLPGTAGVTPAAPDPWTQQATTSGAATPGAWTAVPSAHEMGSYPAIQHDAPMGRMPSNTQYGSGDGAGVPPEPSANRNGYSPAPVGDSAFHVREDAHTPRGAGDFAASGIGQGSTNTTNTPAMSSAAANQGYCSNGHPMPTGEFYCARCGAPRWNAAGPQPGY